MDQSAALLLGRLDERTAMHGRRLDHLERRVDELGRLSPPPRLRGLTPEVLLVALILLLLTGHLTADDLKVLIRALL